MNKFLNEKLMVSFHNGVGTPFVVEVELRQCARALFILVMALVACFMGTLLFLREVQTTARLKDRLFELEAGSKMPVATAEQVPLAHVETMEEVGASARVADTHLECTSSNCTVRVLLVPNRIETAQGELLILLETERPRIGVGNPVGASRHQYISYPGYHQHDQFDPTKLEKLSKKPFRFSKGLQTGASFPLETWMRPLALHIYLFDSKGNVTVHEQKEITRDVD